MLKLEQLKQLVKRHLLKPMLAAERRLGLTIALDYYFQEIADECPRWVEDKLTSILLVVDLARDAKEYEQAWDPDRLMAFLSTKSLKKSYPLAERREMMQLVRHMRRLQVSLMPYDHEHCGSIEEQQVIRRAVVDVYLSAISFCMND